MITSMKKGLVPPGFVAVMLAGKEKLKRQESMFVLAMITAFMITAVFLPGLICPAAANADQVSVAKTGQTTSYAAGDDGDLQKGVAWPDPRFTDNSDGTVTDNLTGLMWAKDANAEGSKTWSSAVDYSNNLTLGNYSDWRLPNIKELLSLFDYSQLDPMLPIDYPFTNVQDYYYWTSTADSRSPTQDAWGVVPYSGNRSSTGHGGHCYVWPVRGESSGPAPVPKTGQTKSYATGDDGDLQKGVTWPNPRFTDNRDGTVTDNLTRLIWLKNARCFGGTWAKALSGCNSLASGICGLMDDSVAGDWRLPNIKELLSLCDYSQFNPTLPSGHPFTHVQDYYGWTSTASAEITSPASFWRVDPIDGNVAAMYNDCSFCVWPVRGPEVATNQPPEANAGDDLAITSEDQDITVVQGTATDPDNDPLTYRWLEGETVLLDSADVGENGEAHLDLSLVQGFSIGEHILTLEVNDGQATSSDEMRLIIENSAPHAAPLGTGIYEINTEVIVSGNVSDFDGDLLYYQWMEGTNVLFSGQVQTTSGGDPVDLPNHTISNLGLGNHTIILSVNDGINDPVTSDITVEVIDTTDPTLAPMPDKTILWPPNHKMVDIVIEANADDKSGGQVYLSATVSSNEPEDGLGDGDMAPDWTEPEIDNGIITLQLRAERSGSGDGRIYTITITATDDSGNDSSADVEIIVPHDKGKK
jgi:hypothetical protein